MILWLAIDVRSVYKLPMYVTDTPEEMAEHYHTSINNVWSAYSHYKESGRERRFLKVEVEDEDETEET